MAKPRITINTTAEGQVEIWFNAEGRDQLVKHILALNERNDHFHFGWDMDIKLSSHPYRPTDKIYEWGKVYFRPDEWDKQYFPHVLAEDSNESSSD